MWLKSLTQLGKRFSNRAHVKLISEKTELGTYYNMLINDPKTLLCFPSV